MTMTSAPLIASVHRTIKGCGRKIISTPPAPAYNCKHMCDNVKNSENRSQELQSTIPEEPTTCCMSGCANCVWIQYAEEMSKLCKGGEEVRKLVLSKVTDPSMKAFLSLELNNLKEKS